MSDDLLRSIDGKLDLLVDRVSPPAKRWLSVAEAAEVASLSKDSVRNMIASGKLKPRRPVGGKLLIDSRELERVIDSATRPVRGGRGRPKAQ